MNNNRWFIALHVITIQSLSQRVAVTLHLFVNTPVENSGLSFQRSENSLVHIPEFENPLTAHSSLITANYLLVPMQIDACWHIRDTN